MKPANSDVVNQFYLNKGYAIQTHLKFTKLIELNYHLKESKKASTLFKQFNDEREIAGNGDEIKIGDEEFCLKGINLLLKHKYFERAKFQLLDPSTPIKAIGKSAYLFLQLFDKFFSQETLEVNRWAWSIVKCSPKVTIDLIEQHLSPQEGMVLYHHIEEEMYAAMREISQSRDIMGDEIEYTQTIIPNMLTMAEQLGQAPDDEQTPLEHRVSVKTWGEDRNPSLSLLFELILCNSAREKVLKIAVDELLKKEHLLLPSKFITFYYRQYCDNFVNSTAQVNIMADVDYWLDNCSLDYLKSLRDAMKDLQNNIESDLIPQKVMVLPLKMGNRFANEFIEFFDVKLNTKLEHQTLEKEISRAENKSSTILKV